MERELYIHMIAITPFAPEKKAQKLEGTSAHPSAPTLDTMRAVAYEARGKRRVHATK